jgi:GTP cyclohydrolase I
MDSPYTRSGARLKTACIPSSTPTRPRHLCEHHVLPIRGSAWVGYLAREKLVGISKLTRIVRLYSKRFTSQERLCHDIANELTKDVQPRGAIVYIEAEHFCMQARGVRELSSRTGALVTRGAYNTTPHLGEEFRLLIGGAQSLRHGA